MPGGELHVMGDRHDRAAGAPERLEDRADPLDAVRAGDIPKRRVNDLGIIVSVWLDPSILEAEDVDFRVLFQTNREATAKAIHKAMNHEPTIDWLLESQEQVPHYFHQLALDGKLE
jgi:formaldehyde-activating enzyme involved in methanogenesis